MKRLVRIGIVTLLVLTVIVTASFTPPVTISSNGGFLSISANTVIAAEPFESPYIPHPEHSINFSPYYTDSLGVLQYIDNSWSSSPLPWNWEMTHDDYRVRVKENITDGQVIEFSR